MITVAYLKKKLAELPDDALVYAYEGEVEAIVVVSADEEEQIAVIHTDQENEDKV